MVKILVVDDDNNIRENIAEILEMLEYNCILAANGKEAIQVLEQDHIDLVISDIKMPFMDGIELFKFLRNNEEYNSKPFIFVTAKIEDEPVIANLNLGEVHYFKKPFRANDLISKIASLI